MESDVGETVTEGTEQEREMPNKPGELQRLCKM